ncbi:GFA family protein [Fulvimarina manganoxydans]|uniref:GFA family protein n=1 Tax=Fulvimarina manganoxydans TaxID=937218 RepID=UPI002351FD52|nr:GFA family protein [Fulvimarina manganoxydans]
MNETIQPVHMPPLPLTGGCQCGQIRYQISAVPMLYYLCHCTECQRQTASAFGESLRCESETVSITGDLATISWSAASGTKRHGDYCPSCGVRILHRSDARPGNVNVKAGTLDDASWLKPAGHSWTRSKRSFVAIPADDLAYAEGPPDGFTAITARWKAMLEAGRKSPSET